MSYEKAVASPALRREAVNALDRRYLEVSRTRRRSAQGGFEHPPEILEELAAIETRISVIQSIGQ